MRKLIKIIIPLILLSLLLLNTTGSVRAVYDPLSVPNNKFGIHIVNEDDLENASALVNSSGGDWGYAVIVIPEYERSVDKWNAIFEKFRQYHLIPIVRLATQVEGAVWKVPQLSDVIPWVDFLSKLNWVVKNRYVIIFNEPNHANEWGGRLVPAQYADLLASFSAMLKGTSSDFFVLPAGLDSSAPNGNDTMEETKFLKGIINRQPEVLNNVDGWVSHSYPNPGFTGSVNASGRGTIRNYLWEEQLLKSLGFPKNLPQFITETGWPHQEGDKFNRYFLSAEEVANRTAQAANNVWNDNRIVVVAPFILNYQGQPFSNFSWQKPDDDTFYPQYDVYRSVPKIAGDPQLYPEITPSLTPIPTQAVLGIAQNQPAGKRSLSANLVSLISNILKSSLQIFSGP